jgi:hypothetical protein
MRAGGFSNATDSNSNVYGIHGRLPAGASGTRVRFSGNKIPPARINPFSTL